MTTPSQIVSIDPLLCTGCRRCAEVCPVNAIIGNQNESQTIDASRCVMCGQCVLRCSAFASPFDDVAEQLPQMRKERGLPEDDNSLLFAAHYRIDQRNVSEMLADSTKTSMVQCAPAVRSSIAEEFGLAPGTLTPGQLAAALRRLGFDFVYDTIFAADVTIMEESSELLQRLESGENLPMFTSCCPGWVRYMETAWPDLLSHLSSCKSPQQMAGALFKTYGAEIAGKSPEQIASVAVMPCTAKKYEAGRPEMQASGTPDVDAVLTVTELADMLKKKGIRLENLPEEDFDVPLGLYSGAGVIFGASGGVMEAALRTAIAVTTGNEVSESGVNFSKAAEGVFRASVDVAGRTVRAVIVSGLAHAAKLLEDVRAGKADFDFMEVMCCTGGCVAGGGQPKLLPHVDVVDAISRRRQSLHNLDKQLSVRVSHKNPSVTALYENYLEKQLGHRSHNLLHTSYGDDAGSHE
ncbi:[Fe-Fe] hydrogenase large subunit C-terminal domain-containing protein [Halodesulfovibrio marinisediminis]|uniref:[FeFe] hydrogenase, group A n=1 Tax=Halodesulfovibrio marinisediminis DSM 17456 TaxID=1121457 RepID=A0A1N6DNQ7_9BACT|nr:[Fe-Fe] hydrogenase large subunit C-terminal domain-containing protein [Halodesulfovibrio marinisediminis]SIN72357.1 [FeFe] hydrogenase, group A [Halodesulfovibrio marinisediminis DSM 17456]